jgi:hypothetical protein
MGALKKPCPPPVPKKPETKKANLELVTENQVTKAEIERMKKLLSEKIKDPKLAQKAALIISEMLNNKS